MGRGYWKFVAMGRSEAGGQSLLLCENAFNTLVRSLKEEINETKNNHFIPKAKESFLSHLRSNLAS